MTVRRTWAESPSIVALLFTAATIAMTWPLARDLAGTLPDGYRDVWQNLWNFWWWKRALVELHRSPYWTPELFFPQGADLAFHTHSELNQLLALPVTLVSGPVAAHNAALLAGFPLSAIGAWLLAREAGADPRAAILAGFVFAFFPYRMEQSLEHMNLSSVQFLPFVAWSFLRLAARPTVASAIVLGVAFAANALVCWHYAIFAVLLLAALGAGEMLRGGLRGRVSAVASAALVAAVVATILVAPFVWPMIRAIAAGESYLKPAVEKGIDLAFLFLPTDRHPLFGPMVAGLYDRVRWSPNPGFYAYVGLVPAALAATALARDRRTSGVRVWLAIGLVSLVLALGSRPLVAGHELGLPFPHALLAWIPGLRVLRVANRFFVPFMLAVSVLAALGATRLRRGPIVAVACVLTLAEYSWWPYPVQAFGDARLAPVFAPIGGDGAVLDVPYATSSPTCARSQALQTVHGRPIAGGYVSVAPRPALEAMREDPLLAALALPRPKPPPIEGWPRRAKEMGFSIVVLRKRLDGVGGPTFGAKHRAEFERRCALAPDVLDALSASLAAGGAERVHEDERLRIFELR